MNREGGSNTRVNLVKQRGTSDKLDVYDEAEEGPWEEQGQVEDEDEEEKKTGECIDISVFL